MFWGDKMLGDIFRNVKNFYSCESKRIPEEYRQEYTKEIVMINWKRANIIQTSLFICNLILIVIDRFYYYDKWDIIPAYRHLYHAHILLLIVIMFYAFFGFFGSKYINKTSYTRFLYLSIMMFSLFWCEFLAINAQLIHGQISAYIISAFCVASIMLLSPVESTIVFIASYLSFVVGLIYIRQNSIEQSGNIINSGIFIILSIIVSKLQYSSFVTNFLNKKLIEKNAARLNELNNKLEMMVEERTSELVQANELLVNELKAKHEMKLEIASTKAIYEEKEKELIEFKELEKLRTAFFSNISHELKTPLNIILSSQQLLELKLKNLVASEIFNQVNKQIFFIKQNSYRLIRLVSNLLDITKIDSGYFELNLRNYDIIKLVEDVVQSVAEYVQGRNINLIFDTQLEEKIIACDADKIERIMLNLLSNAVKFTEEGGSIYVNMFLRGNMINISVRDTGIGISQNMQKIIFDRFVQGEDLLIKNSEGTGIGLSLVKSIAELHQGRVTLKSELGRGSEFIIELPDKTLPDTDLDEKGDKTGNNRVHMINIEFSDIYK
jgi:signal transduction histidine kinase